MCEHTMLRKGVVGDESIHMCVDCGEPVVKFSFRYFENFVLELSEKPNTKRLHEIELAVDGFFSCHTGETLIGANNLDQFMQAADRVMELVQEQLNDFVPTYMPQSATVAALATSPEMARMLRQLGVK